MRPPVSSRSGLCLAALATLLLSSSSIEAAVTAAPGWIAGSAALPGVNATDLTPAGSSFLVGIGAFGAQSQSIVRLDRDGTSTTLVTKLNSIGGLAYDAANDRLLFTDNGLTAPPGTAVTGDTLYALADPLGATSAVSAATLELAPSGSIGFAQAILPLGGGDILIGDAAGAGAGRVVKYSGGVLTNLITGLDYTAGVSLSLTPANELLIGDVDSNTFAGSVDRYSLTGTFIATLAGGLSGALDQAVTSSGNLLLTGGFLPDFSSSTIVSITPAGVVSTIASGFGFSSGIAIDDPSQQVLALDFGTSSIDTLTPVAALTPGGASSRDCLTEAWGGAFDTAPNGRAKPTWTCTDGAACDRDGTLNGSCEFVFGSCFSVTDARLPACVPTAIDGAEIRVSKNALSVLAPIQAAADAILPSTGAACSAGSTITVPARKTVRITVRAKSGIRVVDSDATALRCKAGA
jgi:hypothetical protein